MPLTDRLHRSLQAIPAVFMAEGFWYLILASFAWLALYVVLARWMRRRRIAAKNPTFGQMSWEAIYSLRSLFVFGIVGALLAFAISSGWTRMYRKIDDFGPWYFWLSIGLMILMHDAYFYWTHRLMHHPRLFRTFHRVHHLSTNPSPWAAYSFSVPEAFVQAGIAPVIMFTIPYHPGAFGIFMIWQIGFNVLGHCGHELLPSWFVRSWGGRILNTATHHAMHHESNRVNFSLYFNWWDRWFSTNHQRYEERYAQVTSGAADTKPLSS